MADGLLDRLRVLDLSDRRGQVTPWLLARLGASVVRVVPPAGGDSHDAAYRVAEASMELDPAGEAADRERLLDLVARADVMVEAGPPAATSSWGLDEDELVAANGRLVHVLISPFGADGSRADQPASELTLAALGGPMSLQGGPDRAPVKISVPQAWRHAGAEGALAALVGLRRRDRTDQAQWIDVSAQAAMTWTMLNAMEAGPVQGFEFERTGPVAQLANKVLAYHRTIDGWSVVLPSGRITAQMLAWMQDEGVAPSDWSTVDWASYDHRRLSGNDVEPPFGEVEAAVSALCAGHTNRELLDRGMELGVTFAPVHRVPDLLTFDQLEHRGFWTDETDATGGMIRRPGHPLVIDGIRPPIDRPELVGELDEVWPQRSAPAPDDRPEVDEPDLPLAGVVVADFSWVGVGPITVKALADHGATVVRVESQNRPDILRVAGPFSRGEFGLNRSNFYGSFNTSKQSLALDLSTDAGRTIAQRLCDRADVVIDSFRPGTMARMGMGPEEIHRTNPSAVVVTTSLLGLGGPLTSMAGYGTHAAAIAGFAELVGWPDRGPDGPWSAYTDSIGPRFLTTAILAALRRRERTGRGCTIEGAQLEIALQLLAPEIERYQRTGDLPTRMGNRDPALAPQGAYPCAGDDQWLAITVADDEQWSALVELLGRPDWALDPALAGADGRMAAHAAIDERLAIWTRDQAATELETRLAEVGIPAGKVQRSGDLFDDPQYRHRSFHRWLEHPETGSTPYSGHQYRIRGCDNGPRAAAPQLGQHTFEILADLLGLDTDEIAEAAAAEALE